MTQSSFRGYERRREDNAPIEPTLLTNRTYLSGTAVTVVLFEKRAPSGARWRVLLAPFA